MFFRSAKSTIIAIFLIAFGGFQLIRGLTYADASKRETTTVGTILSAHCGKGCTYAYVFEVNGVRIQDDSDSCKTALTAQGCKPGAFVRVYYDTENLSVSLLQELGEAGRERIFFGFFMVSLGLLLIGLTIFLERREKGSADSGDADQDDCGEESEVLHVVAKE